MSSNNSIEKLAQAIAVAMSKTQNINAAKPDYPSPTLVSGDSDSGVFTASNLVNILISCAVGLTIAVGAYYNFKSELASVKQMHRSELDAQSAKFDSELRQLKKDIDSQLTFKSTEISNRITLLSNSTDTRFQTMDNSISSINSRQSQIQANERLSSLEIQQDNLSRMIRSATRDVTDLEEVVKSNSRDISEYKRGN